MKVTPKQIANWIDNYANNWGNKVYERSWNKKYEYHHAPFNNEEDCYHKWLDWVDENKDRLRALPTFEDILSELLKKEMKGIGSLTKYDTTTQLAFPDKKYPEKVYLNAGATKGAKALGVTGLIVDKQVFVDICPDFKKLTEAQIEDFLCIFKSHLMGEVEDEQDLTNRSCGNPKERKSQGGCHKPKK